MPHVVENENNLNDNARACLENILLSLEQVPSQLQDILFEHLFVMCVCDSVDNGSSWLEEQLQEFYTQLQLLLNNEASLNVLMHHLITVRNCYTIRNLYLLGTVFFGSSILYTFFKQPSYNPTEFIVPTFICTNILAICYAGLKKSNENIRTATEEALRAETTENEPYRFFSRLVIRKAPQINSNNLNLLPSQFY